ncbi:MAG TPA: amino acid adenylation domain-containing protein, partial [Ktedonobacteraceae bacterium]
VALSFAQERLWFLNQLEPANPSYNMSGGVRFQGLLSLPALWQSLEQIVHRHEVLRTTFPSLQGRPVQRLHPTLPPDLLLVDLSALPLEQQDAQARQLASDEALTLFDLARGPLLRARLLRHDRQTHLLLLSLHHISFDAWSLQVLWRELSLLYACSLTVTPSPLPPLPIQYADYALWQRESLRGERLTHQLSYWQTRLAGAPDVLPLPTDHPRPARQTFRGAQHAFSLPTSLRDRLAALSRQEGATLFMTLLAAWQTLLWRYSGQDDLLVGTPVANRTHEPLEGLIGCFLNTLVLRTDLSGDPSFRALLGRVREMALEAYAHQEVPFEQVVEAVQPARDLSHSPLFQVMFVLQKSPEEILEFPGLTPRPLAWEPATAKFEVTLSLQEREHGLEGVVEYNRDLFEPARMTRMAEHFRTLLEGIVSRPEQPISRLPLLTAPEREHLLHTWNATGADDARGRCLHELFEEQVVRSPEAIAVVFNEHLLTYQELDRRANQLAHYLQKAGVGPEVPVCICLERSFELLIGLLGTLKAGGAYVPLDPSYPLERLAFMLVDARAPVLLTQSEMHTRLSEQTTRSIFLDTDWEIIAQENEEKPVSSVQGKNLAYVIYTSGSTGTPKGVMVSHHSICNHMLWIRSHLPFTANDRMIQKASVSFDGHTWEFYAPLQVGAQVIMAQPGEHQDSRYLVETIVSQSITILKVVPSFLQILLNEPGWENCRTLRYIYCGGEELPETLQRRFFTHLNAHLYNLYGPTEASVCTLFWHCKPESAGGKIPIGRPIANTQIYVLDQQMQPVPVGIIGELYIGGDPLARGYLKRADLTAERFLPDPFSPKQGMRLYQTGDLVRYRADGSIEYVGRRDNQIKIRGFRIEPGEIEALLSQHPAIQEVVVTQEKVAEDKRLVAYIVSHREQPLTTSKLRRYLQEKLPDYMLPTAFVHLKDLPFSPNGKLDRRALPLLNTIELKREEAFMAPRSPMEEVLAILWARVLGIARVSIHDNFFELGGHSLLATQVIARLRDVLRLEIPLRLLFEAPTIAGLARRIEHLSSNELELSAPSLVPLPREGDLPLSFSQQRLWFLDQFEPGSPLYNIPAAMRLRGALDATALEQSLNEIVRRHEALRTAFPIVLGKAVQHISPTLNIQISVTDMTTLSKDQCETLVQRLARAEAASSFDLTRGPLLRAHLLRLEREEHVFLLSMHHIISDGWSLSVLLYEFFALYDAIVKGKPSPLPLLPLQYADYTLWQRNWLQAEALQAHLSYWQEHLAGAPATLALPTDRPRPPVQTFQGTQHLFFLPCGLSEALVELARQEGVTLFMLLLAAFATLLSRSSGQEDLVIGTPIANRRQSELEGLIGLFINTLTLRCDLSGNPSFHAFLRCVREVCLDAYAHQDLPFEQLVEALQPQRDLSHTPLFQVMFTLQNAPGEVIDLPGLSLHPLVVESTTAKFDLELTVQETTQGLRAVLAYNTDLFESTTITRMARQWQTLLEGIVIDPEQTISRLPLLTVAEKQQILFDWNATQAPYPQNQCLSRLFETQVEQTPEAIALVSEDEQFTYQELNRRANQQAHHLRSLGIGPEVLIAVLDQRGSQFLIAMLAILKAGGSYLPLDPLSPAPRLRSLLEQSACGFVLVAPALVTTLSEALQDMPPGTRPQVICLEEASAEKNLSVYPRPQQLVYVIYTSGSTGFPKGAMIEERGMLNHLFAMIRALHLTAADTVAQTASQCFDISVWQFLAALLVGGRTQIFQDEVSHDPTRLLTQVERYGISILEVVPTLLAEMLAAEVDGKAVRPLLRPLRWLIPTGEALPPVLCRRWLEVYPHIPLLNAYGPAECSDDVSFFPLTQPLPETVGHIPIGRPIENTRLYVLDRELNPQPIGVTGELYVGGVGVGRGYLGDAARTVEAFLADPFSDEPGMRLYKTGDLARYLPDGNLEFLGRSDQQIKLRGFRIEPGEIEVILQGHPAVQTCAVVLQEDQEQQKCLVGYVVAEQLPLQMSELRNWLSRHLPDYMLPSLLVPLDQLPLLPNGKVDRRALQALRPDSSAQEEGYVAPRSPLEEIVAHIWREVLRRERVGAHDHFFALGGHSLLATQVIARLRDVLHREVPLRTLFEAPILAELAQCLENLSSDKPAFFTPLLESVPHVGNPPLSFAQQRLWFLDQLEPANCAYLIPMVLRLRGKLDIASLQQSLNELVHRHEALRTTFEAPAGKPVQVIAPYLLIRLPLVDLSHLSVPQQNEQIRRLAGEESTRPFNLAQGPLLRFFLLRQQQEEHVLFLTMHHIITDGWSQGVLLSELSSLYRAFVLGQPSPLQPLPVQYADYTLWQRDWLQGEVLQAHLAYWQQQLAAAPTALVLPTYQPRPPVQTFRGDRHFFILSQDLSAALVDLSRKEGVTLFMTLLAAFATLLSRSSGQEDLLVGTPIANRTQSKIEKLIGFFVNTLVLRIDLSDNPSFRSLIGHIREVTLQAYAHQDLPFEMLVERLQPERDLSRNPLFQVMFELQNGLLSTLELPDLDVRLLAGETKVAQFDLTLSLVVTEQDIRGVLAYNSDLFEVATISRMVEHYQVLLQRIVADVDRRISDIPFLTEDEKRLMLTEWNASRADYPENQSFPEIFEAQVQRTPDAIAVVFEQEQLTYRELNRQANHIASQLRTLGVRPESLIAVLDQRGSNLLIAMLAIFKAGGCYLPLDPFHPTTRLRYLLESSRCDLVLVMPEFASKLFEVLMSMPASAHPRILPLDKLLQQAHDKGNLPVRQAPQQLAYVIYTSGSTGLPKGAMIEERGMLNHLLTMVNFLHLTAADTVAQTASQCFDISVWQFLAALLVGGRIQVFSDELMRDPLRLLAQIERYGVSILEIVPTLLAGMLEVSTTEDAPSLPLKGLRWLIPTGEALPPVLCRRWLKCYPGIPLLNAYGPAECSDDVSFFPLTQPLPETVGHIPIGRPVQNMRLYVLDRKLNLQPIGVAGELYVGGVGVGRGYLGDAARTAEAFLADPFSDEPGMRLYKTGDLARYLPDGNLEFLGRSDHQVKVRGYRIEPGEVEIALGQHPDVQEVVVVAREDISGEKRLVAYLVMQQTKISTRHDLYNHLKERLPGYMIPTAFVELEALPLTPNGKIDRAALPPLEGLDPGGQASYVAPRTSLEQAIAIIWQAVLHLERVGVNDNFFDLGGHSLLLVQVQTGLQAVSDERLSIIDLFQYPTISALARYIQKDRGRVTFLQRGIQTGTKAGG